MTSDDRSAEIVAALDDAWGSGLWRGDAVRLRVLGAARPEHPRASELMAFARLAALVEGHTEDEAWEPVIEVDPAIQVIDRAARAWHATVWRQVERAAEVLEALDHALAALPASGARAHAARALADLVLAEIAIVCGDLPTARRRLQTVIRRRVPVGTAIAARLALALRTNRPDRTAIARGRALLDEASALAATAARPGDAARAAIHAGVLCALGGDPRGAIARLERGLDGASPTIDPELRLVGRIILAGVREGDRGFEDLGRGLAAAAEAGDYFGTVTLLTMGSRKALALGRLADAIAILDNGAERLDGAIGAGAGRPLRDERERLRATCAPAAFAEAEREAARLRAQR